MKEFKHTSYVYDWKNKRGWPYKDNPLEDPEYIRDRNALFKENGNGWWWYQGYNLWKHGKKITQIDQVED